MKNLNVGCGQSPTPGWTNYDNSFCVRLINHPIVFKILVTLKLLNSSQFNFVVIAKKYKIKWADIRQHIPEKNNSVDAIYLCRVLENFEKYETQLFFKEALRILLPGGIIRISAMDIKKVIIEYLAHNNANRLMEIFYSTRTTVRSFKGKVVQFVFGERNRKWYYDPDSLMGMLTDAGFEDVRHLQPGNTSIEEPGELNLSEGVVESMFVEARKPKFNEVK